MNSIDPALKGIGRKEGLEIWRVHDFKLEKVPAREYGVFYEGDSYIILKTKEGADSWDVHFWLGKDATIDEQGTAAIKTVEIDQSLGGFPTQYREVQGHESPLFLSYFRNGIRYLSGGYDSGFHHLEGKLDNFKPVLYQCKGKRNVRSTQVKLAKESLNLGDVFILDLGKDIYVWMPPDSGRLERIKGMERAKDIVDFERPGLGCVVHVLDENWKDEIKFWKHFGGKEVIPRIAKAKNDDENYWKRHKEECTLFKVSDTTGKVVVQWIADGDNVKQKLLDTKDAFVLDADNGGIFVWVGKGCTMAERQKAFHWGQEFLKLQKLPPWTTVTRVLETAEPVMFTQWFADWQNAKKKLTYSPRLFQCSNETGKLIVDEIVGFTQESLDGDDVMILDAMHLIYVWVGAGANPDEKKHAEKTAQEYLSSKRMVRHKKTTIDTIFQGEETPTFKKFFPKWDDKLFKGQVRSVANMRKLLFK